MRRFVFIMLALAVLVGASSASARRTGFRRPALYYAEQVPNKQVLTVVNEAHITAALLRRDEIAVEVQVNLQVRAVYPNAVPFTFGAGGWLVVIVPTLHDVSVLCRGNYNGCHIQGPNPVAVVSADPRPSAAKWEYVFSHELVEESVDPYGGQPEVCDSIPWSYTLLGMPVARFVGGPKR
jgi:hypothetical protein